MLDGKQTIGWRGVGLIAAIYVYFLIFAQFAFLARLDQLQIGADLLRTVMAVMAAGGILFSLLTTRVRNIPDPATRLRIGLAICALAALLTLLPLRPASAAPIAFFIGAGLGISTVTLVTHLRAWTGENRGMLKVGLGTGAAYFICNIPAIFTAKPQVQAILAAGSCVLAMMVPLKCSNPPTHQGSRAKSISFTIALTSFLALIWLDSAAFYIIQHTPELKAGTWLGSTHLWINGSLHLLSALAAGIILQRGRAAVPIALAFGALAFAAVLLQKSTLTLSASLFYPIGVSMYSVALVAYPSFLTTADSIAERGKQAGWIYAVAGWIGSALGIGMGQNLGHVPLVFVAIAGVVILGPMSVSVVKQHPSEFALIAAIGVLSLFANRLAPRRTPPELTPAQRGRQVYISEGCISCHSQYVRPNSPDVLMWGPAESLEELHAQQPPLIGNRRQGPDLSQVGLRRSPLWLKAHLVDPARLSYHSPMPSFAFLFQDERGGELVAYLSGLHGPSEQEQLQREAAWSPSSSAFQKASISAGRRVYQQYCATCHDPDGSSRLQWINDWRKTPPTLAEMRASAARQPESNLARIAKFGMTQTDMPGHEYLNDEQIASVALWLKNAPMLNNGETSPR